MSGPTEAMNELDQWHAEFGPDVKLAAQEFDQMLERLNKAKDLVRRILDTGYIRTDETRQLWDDVNEFLKL